MRPCARLPCWVRPTTGTTRAPSTELGYAIERGAVGATCNPPIVVEVLGKERDYWVPRVLELVAANPTWSEVELTWAIYRGDGRPRRGGPAAGL